jgi:hypothetical protein
MSLAERINQRTDLKQRDYGSTRNHGFILAQICAALALVVASMVFKPAAIGSGITSEITTTGL